MILRFFTSTRNLIVSTVICILLFSSCSSLDIKQNKTDPLKEHRETDSKPILQIDEEGYAGRSLKELILGESNAVVSVGDQITFQVALDKVSFMPLNSVDSASGVIITDWYNIDKDNLRLKINIRVLNNEFENNSIDVQIFKQNFDGQKWIDQGSDPEQASKIKKSILDEARTLQATIDLS